jgi:hypothetical protein
MSNPMIFAFVGQYGVKLLAEFEWEKAYFPWFTQLFNPSKELTASDIKIFFLIYRVKRMVFPPFLNDSTKNLKDKEYLPEELAAYGKILRKVVVGVS